MDTPSDQTIMKKWSFLVILLLCMDGAAFAQSPKPVLATSQIGFMKSSPKMLTLTPEGVLTLPDSIPFYIHMAGMNLPRVKEKSGLWAKSPYPYPFEISEGKYDKIDPSMYDYTGWLVKKESRWGTIWQADFSDFTKEGLFQVETLYQFSLPFSIESNPYEKLVRGYMIYIHSQRSGYDVYGVREAEHLDDGRLDNGAGYHDAAGGWYNAGDLRKWMSLTQFNMEALFHIFQFGPELYRNAVVDEMQWGNLYFQNMISDEGQVYEDIGGGDLRPGFEYSDGWWAENHPGCIANNAGNYFTDNIPNTGDERTIRTSYNPFVQLAFVKNQAMISTILPAMDAAKCKYLAEKAWKYFEKHPHDNRTLFISMQLEAAVELANAGSELVNEQTIADLITLVLARQDNGKEGLSHYFVEKDEEDAFRSVAFSCLPATALIRAWELDVVPLNLKPQVKSAVAGYIDQFLLADAKSNPYELTPYGAFIKKPLAEYQLFRDAGRGRGVRTFIHPFNAQTMVHGTNGTVMNQAYLLAKAGFVFENDLWKNTQKS
ncbi:MAG: hypothetical protein HC819_02490 [Cyclobacteriaceae bacterium]|nr:hypothetical protein [Cyclobacteriaceae bacterium]